MRKGLGSLASLSFSLMWKEPNDEGETGMFLEILWSAGSISNKYSSTDKQENSIQRRQSSVVIIRRRHCRVGQRQADKMAEAQGSITDDELLAWPTD